MMLSLDTAETTATTGRGTGSEAVVAERAAKSFTAQVLTQVEGQSLNLSALCMGLRARPAENAEP